MFRGPLVCIFQAANLKSASNYAKIQFYELMIDSVLMRFSSLVGFGFSACVLFIINIFIFIIKYMFALERYSSSSFP